MESRRAKKDKKKFGSLKNGCTFALAFAGKTGKRLRGGGDSSLKRLKQEIACVRSRFQRGPEGDTESQRYRTEILTMKSLILAQDER